jgi:anti-sigma B factor antagonist
MTVSMTEHVEGCATVLDISGEIDLPTVPAIRARLGQLVDAGVRTVVVDLAAVRFIDSAGIAVLIAGHRLLGDVRGALYVRNARGQVAQVLRLTGVADLLSVPAGLALA